jgi:hypothetical protein
MRRRTSLVRVTLLTVAVALPLAAHAVQQQRGRGRGGGDDEETAGGGPASVRFDGPVVPAATRIEDSQRERGDPALAATSDGRFVLVAIEHEVGAGDRLTAWWLGPDGRPTGAAVPVTTIPAQIVRPAVVAERNGVVRVFWTQLVDGVGQIFEAKGGEKQFGAARALTAGKTQHRHVAAAIDGGGRVWLAWEEWLAGASEGARGSFDVMLAPLVERGSDEKERDLERLGEPTRVGGGPFSSLDPALACVGDDVWVAFSQYRSRDYEVVLRRFNSMEHGLHAPIEVSADAPSDDVHPALAVGPTGELWLAWDRIEDGTRGSSTPPDLRSPASSSKDAPRPPPARASVRVACVRDGKVAWPRAAATRDAKSNVAGAAVDGDGLLPGIPFLSLGGGRPQLAVTGDGRVAVATRRLDRRGPGGHAYGFAVLLHWIDADGIAAPVELAGSEGGLEEPAIAASGSACLVAWQQDRHSEVETGTLIRRPTQDHFDKLMAKGVILSGSLAPSGVGIARAEVKSPSSGGASSGALTPAVALLAPPHFHPLADPAADPIASGRDHFRVAEGATTFNVYWGDLHRHSSVSRCSRGLEPGPDDRWSLGRDVCLYDFMALTEHSCHVDARGWWRLDARGQLENTPDFCALSGFEWSTGFYGHENVILRDGLTPYLSNMYRPTSTPAGLYAALDPARALAIPHHPADVTRRTDFSQCNPDLVRLVEIYQAQRGNYEFDGCYKQSHQAQVERCFAQDAPALLDVGFIASTDHGEGASYAAVLAESLDRGHVFDALRARRSYGATTKGILVDFRVDDHLMGESFMEEGVAGSRARRVHLKLHGTQELADVVVFRNGAPWQVVGRKTPAPNAGTELTLWFESKATKLPTGSPWQVRVSSPGGTFEPWSELPTFARNDLSGGLPSWRTSARDATFTWNGDYAGHWEIAMARIHLRGPRDAPVTVEAGPDLAAGKPRAFAKTTTLGELAAAAAACRGDTPFGPWQLGVRESLDAAITLANPAAPLPSLGTRDFEQEWSDPSPPPGRSWYYARVVQADGEMAWSSPVYVTAR